MKAAILKNPGSPLVVIDAEEPKVLPGAVKVRVERATVPSFTGAVLSGNMPFPLPVPYIPGPSCVGVVEAIGEGVYGLAVGQRVLCGPHYSSGINGSDREEILIGWFGLTPGSGPLMQRWKNGAFAERAVYPAACVTPLIEGAAEELMKIAPLCISYGALLRGELRPGQAILVNGATGNLGSGVVLVALAMGASRVLAVGRNQDVLEQLHALDHERVIPLAVSGDPETYSAQLEGGGAPVDVVIDALGYLDDPAPTKAAIARLRPGGTAVFMGGVMVDIPVSYLQLLGAQLTIRGSFMHPASAAAELYRMVRSGSIDLSHIHVVAIPLEEVNRAIAEAPRHRGLSFSAIAP